MKLPNLGGTPGTLTHLVTLLAGALALFNVPPDLTGPVRSAVVGVAGLVAAVWVHEKHATERSANQAAAVVSSARHAAAQAGMVNDLGGALSGLMSALPGAGPAPVAPSAGPVQPSVPG